MGDPNAWIDLLGLRTLVRTPPRYGSPYGPGARTSHNPPPTSVTYPNQRRGGSMNIRDFALSPRGSGRFDNYPRDIYGQPFQEIFLLTAHNSRMVFRHNQLNNTSEFL